MPRLALTTTTTLLLALAAQAEAEERTLCAPGAGDCADGEVCVADEEIDPALGVCDEAPGWHVWLCDSRIPGEEVCDCGFECAPVSDASPLGVCAMTEDHCHCDWAGPDCGEEDGDDGHGEDGGDGGEEDGGDGGEDGGVEEDCEPPETDDDVAVDPCGESGDPGEEETIGVAEPGGEMPAASCSAGGASGPLPLLGLLVTLSLLTARRSRTARER